MEIYGHFEGTKKAIKPDEVALLFTFDELLKFKEFIDFCVEGMRTNDEFSHEHFSDFLYYRKYKLHNDDKKEIVIYKYIGNNKN
ncbi:MAG: hypothetical protein LBT96_01115 [Campylobacteraceae bacterium]|jgi:hypothetical protein|nr:hypothetical protein [Campylobacteraceae bacterium]